MFKKFVRSALLGVAVLSLVATGALAANSGNKGGNTTIQYSLSYADFGGPVVCAGIHQYGKNWPGTAIAGGRDSFTCTSTTGSPLTGVTPGQVVAFGVGGWASDYFNSLTPAIFITNAQAFSVTVSADGFSYSGVALYF